MVASSHHGRPLSLPVVLLRLPLLLLLLLSVPTASGPGKGKCGNPTLTVWPTTPPTFDLTGCTSLILDAHTLTGRRTAALAAALGATGQTTLHTLRLDRKQHIDDAGARALATTLGTHPTITKFDMSHNLVGDAGAADVATLLVSRNAVITEMYVDDNRIGDAGTAALATSLQNDNRHIERFTLRSNRLGDAGAAALALMLRTNTILKHLHVATNRIGLAGTIALAQSLGAVNVDLQTLELANNQIGDAGVRHIAVSLNWGRFCDGKGQKECFEEPVMCKWVPDLIEVATAEPCTQILSAATANKLQTLDLSANRITGSGIQPLASMVAVDTVMSTFVLDNNDLGDVGGVHLGAVLRTNAAITTLSAQSNGIGDAGAVAIAGALYVNAVLLVLDLRGNAIGDKGAIAIAEALKNNTVLQQVLLDDNKVGGCAWVWARAWCALRESEWRISMHLRESMVTTCVISCTTLPPLSSVPPSPPVPPLPPLPLYLRCTRPVCPSSSTQIGDDGARAFVKTTRGRSIFAPKEPLRHSTNNNPVATWVLGTYYPATTTIRHLGALYRSSKWVTSKVAPPDDATHWTPLVSIATVSLEGNSLMTSDGVWSLANDIALPKTEL
jgi:Ran GTPase-activating protein (RanGAP) involved in mRNA processing and transport